MKKIKDFFKYNLCDLKKIYYVNNFIIQDAKSIYYLLLGKKYKKEIKKITIIPSTFCQGNCTFCANRYLKDKRGNISIDTFKKVADEWKSLCKDDIINLTPTIGEVFIDPTLFKKIDYLNQIGLNCTFYTNGFLLGKNIDKLLSSKNITRVAIDIGDILPKYDAQVFQVSEELSKQKIKSIIEFIGKNKRIKISLDFRPMRKFSEILKDIKKTPLGDYYRRGLFTMGYNTAYDNWGGLIKKKDLLGFQVMKRAPKIKKCPCSYLSNFCVLPNGDIRICGCRIVDTFQDEFIVGNINKCSLEEAFNSEKYDRIIKGFHKGKLPKVCESCTFYRPKM